MKLIQYKDTETLRIDCGIEKSMDFIGFNGEYFDPKVIYYVDFDSDESDDDRIKTFITITRWLGENCQEMYGHLDGEFWGDVGFEGEKDAVLFKLVWG